MRQNAPFWWGCETFVMPAAADCVTLVGRRTKLSRAEGFGLVLMDCQMPALDGDAATQAIRALPEPASRIRIVAMTAHAMAGDRKRCLEAGVDDSATKPQRIAEFARTLRAVLTRSAA